MQIGETKIMRAHRRPEAWNGIELYLFGSVVVDGHRKHYAAKPVEMVPRKDGEEAYPLIRLSNQEAQTLMDEMWREGIRPSDGEGSTGQLAATQKHLEDMRTLVFKRGK